RDRAEADQLGSMFSGEAPGAPAALGLENESLALSPGPASHLAHDALLSRCTPSDWSPDKKTMLFFNDEQGPGTEEFRTLRSRLYQMREKKPLKKILVTSSLPQEGKSFVAANLAQALAWQQGRRVLLIDGDLRASRLHLALGSRSTPGLSEYLRGE